MVEIQDWVVVTARRLADGAPVYLRADGSWSAALAEAATFETDPANAEASARTQSDQHLVCDPYTFPVRIDAGKIEALSTRERIRSQGPTVRVRRPD